MKSIFASAVIHAAMVLQDKVALEYQSKIKSPPPRTSCTPRKLFSRSKYSPNYCSNAQARVRYLIKGWANVDVTKKEGLSTLSYTQLL